jgi:translocator protein
MAAYRDNLYVPGKANELARGGRWVHRNMPRILSLVATASVAVAANVVAQVLVPAGRAKGEYAKSTRPWFSPPPWAFGVVWPINNALTVWATWRVLNAAPSADKTAYLRLQAVMCLLFMTHGLLRFRLRSPILGALNSFTFTALAAASAERARRIEPALLASYATLIPWLVLASALSACQLGDPDAVFERSIGT